MENVLEKLWYEASSYLFNNFVIVQITILYTLSLIALLLSLSLFLSPFYQKISPPILSPTLIYNTDYLQIFIFLFHSSRNIRKKNIYILALEKYKISRVKFRSTEESNSAWTSKKERKEKSYLEDMRRKRSRKIFHVESLDEILER